MTQFRARDEQATREMAVREAARIQSGQAPITGPVGMTALVSTLQRFGPSATANTLSAWQDGPSTEREAAEADAKDGNGRALGWAAAGAVGLVLVVVLVVWGVRRGSR